MEHAVSYKDVRDARERIRPHLLETPIFTCATLDAMSGARLFFKCEQFNKSGSFKARGAMNAVLSLPESAMKNGVVTHSSGNHAQALAMAAQSAGVPAFIVMPSDCPSVKKTAVIGYGATVYECQPTQASREQECERVRQMTGAEMVHPSENPKVIAGQGTVGLEAYEQVSAAHPRGEGEPPFDAIIAPVGGGGLVGGIAAGLSGLDPRIAVIAAEPERANDAYLSKKNNVRMGHDPANLPLKTIADGVKTVLGPNTWPLLRDLVSDVVCLSEEEIGSAVQLVYERMKLVIEPTAGLGLAVMLSEQGRKVVAEEVKKKRRLHNLSPAIPDKLRVAIVLCGGNVDLAELPFIKAKFQQ